MRCERGEISPAAFESTVAICIIQKTTKSRQAIKLSGCNVLVAGTEFEPVSRRYFVLLPFKFLLISWDRFQSLPNMRADVFRIV